MIRKLIFNGLIFITYSIGLAQNPEIYVLPFPNQKLNPDSLRADSIKRIVAFPEYFRPYIQELSHQESNLDQVIRIKKDYKDHQYVFVREFLEPMNPLMFGTPISTDTLILNDSIRKKLEHIIRHENYFGFTNGKLTLTEQFSIKQLENLTTHTFISADRKAVLFYESVDSNWRREEYPMLYYYYYEDILVAVGISDRVFTTEVELSQFANMKSLPGIVSGMFELEEYMKQ